MRIALLGAGHIGGSLALALKQSGGDVHITAYDALATHAEQLHAMGGADAIAIGPAEAVRGADMVILATPLRTYRALAAEIAPALTEGAIVTDVGSVKQTLRSIAPLLPNARVVPGHPIAGSELSGPSAARADMFRKKLCILTPEDGADADAVAAVETIWHLAGADVLRMPTEVHDQIYAQVSHLPHYIAFIAASYFHEIGIHVKPEDAVLQQFLRISRSSARMWTDVALENREALLPVLSTFIAVLEHFATELRAGEYNEVRHPTEVAQWFLPRLLASSLISGVSLYEKQSGMNLRPFGAGGMRDIVAPAAQAPEADMEAISRVSHALAAHVDGILPRLRTLEQQLGAEDEAALFASLTAMVADAHAVVEVRN